MTFARDAGCKSEMVHTSDCMVPSILRGNSQVLRPTVRATGSADHTGAKRESSKYFVANVGENGCHGRVRKRARHGPSLFPVDWTGLSPLQIQRPNSQRSLQS